MCSPCVPKFHRPKLCPYTISPLLFPHQLLTLHPQPQNTVISALPHSLRGIVFLGILLIWATGCPARKASVAIFVAPNGHDTATGSKASPFASLERARDEVRKLKAENDHRDIVVYLRGGVYHLSQTLVFGPEDSAAPGYSVTWSSYAEETPVISGGIQLENWERTSLQKGRIWVTNLPQNAPLNRTLYKGSGRLPRARGKGFIPAKQYPSWNMPHTDTIEFPASALKDYADLSGAEIVARTSAAWSVHILPLLAVDELRQTATTAPGIYSLGRIRHRPSPPDAMWVENVLDELDEPGEWTVHHAEGKLYYYPQETERPEGIILPVLTELIRIEGINDTAGDKDTPVSGLHFSGLTFMHADRLPAPADLNAQSLQHGWDFFDTPNAMLRFRGAQDCVVVDCHFTAGGGNAIRLDLYAKGIKIERNLFNHLGGAAAVFAGYGPGLKDVNADNTFSANHVHHVSELNWDRPALMIWQSGSNTIAGNLFHNLPYVGISISCRVDLYGKGEGWGTRRDHEITGETRLRGRIFRSYEGWKLRERFLHARNNRVEGNELFAVMDVMDDGNAIYISGAGSGNIVRRNYVHNNWTRMDAAIRCDDDQHETLVEENIIFNNSSGGNAITIKGHNDVINNFLINTWQMPEQKHYGLLTYATFHPDGSTIERNIFYSPEPDWIRPVLAGQGRVLDAQGLQREEPIDLSRSNIRNNLFWSPKRPSVQPLPSGGGMDGWKMKAISGMATIDLSENLSHRASGYISTGQHSGNTAGALRQRGQWALLTRDMAEADIATGYLWGSFLSKRSSTLGYSDRTGIYLTTPGTESAKGLYIGTQGRRFGIGHASGEINLASKAGNTENTTHLVVFRIDLGLNRVDVWFDPTSMNSLQRLGAPDLSHTDSALRRIGKTAEIRIEGRSAEDKLHLDALRLAHGSSESDTFAAIATGTAASGVHLLADDFEPINLGSNVPAWGTSYLAAAQRDGYEQGSKVADPLFTDAARGDFSFLAGSPAPAMGIVALDANAMGLDRKHWLPRLAALSIAQEATGIRAAKALGERVLRDGGAQAAVAEDVRDLNYIP